MNATKRDALQPYAILCVLMLLAALFAFACDSSESTPSDGDTPDGDVSDGDSDTDGDVDGDGDREIETEPIAQLVRECSACHDLQAATATHGDETKGPREWLASQQVSGLLSSEPAIPAPGIYYDFPWPHRGRHTQMEMDSDCTTTCHPTDALGLGHSVRSFTAPTREKVFEGGTDCATACHGWLQSSVTTQGFDGGAQSYTGTMRPGELLTAVETAHTSLWRAGYRPEEGGAAMKVAGFNPGCGGCHQVQEENHGESPSCLTCHDFEGVGSTIHGAHVAAVEAGKAANDPNGPDTCAYCHAPEDLSGTTHKSLCYSCHLSAHQPLAADGQPHFWKGE